MPLQLFQLHGQRVVDLGLDDETPEWVFTFSGQCRLWVAASWRVVTPSEIVAGHEDDGQWFGLKTPFDTRERVMRTVAGQEVTEACVREFGDLSVRFGADAALEVFNHSAGYEGWRLLGPGERAVVAQGGGRVVDSER